jgi:phosphoglycolate phosphatase
MKTIIIDFDGTIGDTRSCIVGAMQVALKKMGLPQVEDNDIINLIGLPLIDTFRHLTNLSETDLEKAAQIYRDNFSDLANGGIKAFPHVQATIKSLARQGYTLAVASSRGRQSLETLIKDLGLDEAITIILGDQDVTEKKPAPEMVIKILEKTDTPASEALVIGDTVYDIEMGRRAGCKTCGVTYGNNTQEQLETSKPDYIVDDFADITGLLDVL